MRLKKLSYLAINVATLPGLIDDFDRKARKADADRCRSMLKACTAELRRRRDLTASKRAAA